MKRLERFHNPSTIISPLLSVILFFHFPPLFPFLIVLFFIIAHGYVVIFSALRSFVGSGTWKGSQEPVSRERKGGRGESFFRPYFSFSLEGSSFFIFFSLGSLAIARPDRGGEGRRPFGGGCCLFPSLFFCLFLLQQIPYWRKPWNIYGVCIRVCVGKEGLGRKSTGTGEERGEGAR